MSILGFRESLHPDDTFADPAEVVPAAMYNFVPLEGSLFPFSLFSPLYPNVPLSSGLPFNGPRGFTSEFMRYFRASIPQPRIKKDILLDHYLVQIVRTIAGWCSACEDDETGLEKVDQGNVDDALRNRK